jgi:hypothetical protein
MTGKMKWRWGRIFQVVLAILVALYVGDWVVQRVAGSSSVQVEQFLRTPLKGQKEEFDYMGTVAQPCARSLSILSLDAVFHSALLEPGSEVQQRLLPSLELLLLAAAICLASGAIFREWEQKAGQRDASLVGSLPMLIFWWASGAMALLFGLAWLLNLYFPVRGPVNG